MSESINKALLNAKAKSDIEDFKTIKRMLDSYTSEKENVNSLIQEMYRLLQRKVEDAMDCMEEAYREMYRQLIKEIEGTINDMKKKEKVLRANGI